MVVEIIAVGTEILMGQITNTNAAYLAERFVELGLSCYFQTVVGDNAQRLKEVLQTAKARSDIIITTGGLGPTDDDLTKQTVVDFCGLTTHTDNKVLENIHARFNDTHVPENNLKQAHVPDGCTVLYNENGTAPGIIIEHYNKTYILLPGPPTEMRRMFEKQVFWYLKQKSDCILESRVLRIFGIGESLTEEKLGDIMKGQTNPTIALYAKECEVSMRITAKASSRVECVQMLREKEKEIRDVLGEVVYASGDDNSMEKTVCELLKEHKLTISIAESCTGGLVSSKITSISGVSQNFSCGVVTYSDQQKTELLSVSQDTLKKHGAVSEQTALEMCLSVKNLAQSDIGLSITGIAGPGGGSDEKPVGLVYVAIATRDKLHCEKFNFTGNRNDIQLKTAMNALDLVRKYCLNLQHNSDIIQKKETN